MYNKKLLSKIDLGKYNKPNPYAKDIITDPDGQYKYPGKPTRIPSSNITMKGIGYPVLGIADNGQKQMMQPGQDYVFPGAKYVDEFPQMKKGGGLNSKKYTKSLDGVGSLFKESELFKKPKSKKKKLFHPNAKYFQDGGLMTQEEIDGATEGMMKARLAYAQMHGNPAAQRMVVAPDQPYEFDDGDTGTHYMASMGDYAVPLIQNVNGQLMLGDFGPDSKEAMRFDNPEDAMYFADHYKQVTPDESYRQEYQMGGAACPPGYVKHPLTGECVIVNTSDISKMPAGDKRTDTIRKAVFAQDVDQTQQYFRDYYDSPRYKDMIINSAGPQAYVYTQTRKNNLETIPSVVNDPKLRDRNALGTSYNETGAIKVDQQRADYGTMSHEFSHSSDRPSSVYTYPGMNAIYQQGPDGNWFISSNSTGNIWKPITDPERAAALSSPFGGTTEYNMARVIPPKDISSMKSKAASSYLNSPYYYRLSPEEQKKYKAKYESDAEFKKEQDAYLNYVTEPTETRARLNAIRFEGQDTGIYDPFKQKVDPATYRKLEEQNIKGLNELRKFYTDEEIIKMLNTISKNQDKQESIGQTQMAKKGGTIKKFAKGGTTCPPGKHWDGKKCVPNEERTFVGTASQFIPGYETYLDLQDIYNGISLGDTEQLNRGIVALGSPMGGKALTNSVDYVTEKTLGKTVADKNATKRNDILNMSDTQRQKLYLKYGPGGYDKWIKDGKPKLAVGGTASSKDLDPEHMKRYLADLRMQENNIKKGYKNGMWYPHASVEGGADTIAYGHKLTPNDSVLRRGITEDQALKLQEQDVLKNQAIAKKQVDKKYGPGTFDNLPQDSQMLLVDYQYNLGTLSGFPSFVKATVEGNKEKMLAEHKRFGAGKPLTKRNEWTANVINNLEIPKPYDAMKEVTVPLANVPDATSVVQPDFLQGPTAVELPPQKYQGGGVVELNGNQYVKNPANGTWTFTSGAPVTDTMTIQKLNYGEGKPVGSPVVQEAPGRQKAKETVINASKNVKPQPIESNIPRANVADATSVTQPYIQKPSFLDQPGPAKSLADSQKLLQDEAQRLITSGAAKDMGITAKYLSPQNANSANPKSLQQLMIEEMTKKDFQKRLDQSRLNKVNKKWNESSTLGKVADVTRSFLADPINVAEEAIWGDQYLPDRANILRDPRNPLNPYYRKETGYDQSSINNMVSMINPFSSAADATVYARQGNLLGTATQFGEGLLKAAVLTKAPGLLNSAMSRRVNLGLLGVTDLGTIAGGVGVGAGTLALPTTADALYKAGRTGKKEDWRAAVNQTLLNATDFIAPEVLGSKGALSAILKGEKLTPLQQLSRQNILTGTTANNLNDLSLSTPALDQALDMSRNIRSYREQQSVAPDFASLQDDTQYQLMDLYDQRRAVDRTLQDLRNQGATNSPYFQGALDERDYLTRQIDNLNTQTRDRIAAIRQEALGRYTGSQSEFPSFSGTLPSSSSASNVDDIINRVQQLRLEPTPAPAPITRTAPRTVSPVQTDAELQDALTAARERIDALPEDSEERRMFEVFASELRSSIDARNNYSSAILQLENAKRNHAAAGLQETNDLVMQAQADLVMAKENLKIADPDYLKINETSRQSLNEARQSQLASNTPTGSIDLTRRTPGVTTYEGTNLPAVSPRANLFEGALSDFNIANEPIEFSETTRTALNTRPPRRDGTGSLMTIGAQLRASSDPIEFANRLRHMLASGHIDINTYNEISKNFRNTLGKSPNAADIFEFDSAKLILETDPKMIYTGSTLSANEALNELKAIPKDELDDILLQNYGYSSNDLDFIFNSATGISDDARKIALNQILDDYEYASKYGALNPHAHAIDFRNGEIVSPRLKNSVDELDLLGVSKKSSDVVKKTAYKGKNPTTGIVKYNNVMEKTIHKIKDKADLLSNKDLDEQLEAYEEVYSKLKNMNSIEAKDIRNKLEDLRGTKHLRTVYADELKAAGLSPSEIEKISIVSNDEFTKSLVSGDGDVLGSVKFDKTQTGIQIGSTGVNYKFHPHSIKHSKVKDWDVAQKELTKKYLDEELLKVTDPSERNNPIVVKSLTKKANNMADAHIAQLQINNNNKFGEALYAGLHHGVKNTRGGMYTKQNFVNTDLPDAITGEIITRPRAQNFWHSKIKDFNDQGVPRAAMQQGPLEKYQQDWLEQGNDNRAIFWVRKLGGDVSKLSRFIG